MMDCKGSNQDCQGDRKVVVMMDPAKEIDQVMVDLRHAAQHVLGYLYGTVGYGWRHVSYDEVQLLGYTDSNWTENAEDKKSTLR